jgi:DNA modification methylase
MRSINVSEIVVAENRQRREFDPEKVEKLAQSIQTKGLMHPPVLRPVGDKWQLVAGERRLRAISFIWMTGASFKCNGHHYDSELGEVPFTDIGSMSAIDAEEAELEENTIRADLTWQERAVAQKRLDDLRKAQAAAKGTTHTTAMLAEEVGRNSTDIRNENILASHLDKPEVAGAKTARDAFKALKRIEAKERNADLAALIGDSVKSSSHTLVNAEAWEWLTAQADEQFDCILSDPPYGMGADDFGNAGGALVGHEHAYVDSKENFENLMSGVMRHLFRVAKVQAHMYLFCDIDRYEWLRACVAVAGWAVHRTPLIWAKPTAHRVPWPEMGPRRHWEMILYAVKGKKPVNMIAPDVLTFAADTNLGHAAQKPVALFGELLRRSVVPGNKVLDFCCGTGPIFPAAQSLKCEATGCEVDASTFAIAAQRLEGMK